MYSVTSPKCWKVSLSHISKHPGSSNKNAGKRRWDGMPSDWGQMTKVKVRAPKEETEEGKGKGKKR